MPGGRGCLSCQSVQWAGRMRRLIIGAPDRLVEAHRGAGHEPGLVGCQEGDRARRLGRVDQPSVWLSRRRLFQPAVGLSVMLALYAVLALGRHPAEVEA